MPRAPVGRLGVYAGAVGRTVHRHSRAQRVRRPVDGDASRPGARGTYRAASPSRHRSVRRPTPHRRCDAGTGTGEGHSEAPGRDRRQNDRVWGKPPTAAPSRTFRRARRRVVARNRQQTTFRRSVREAQVILTSDDGPQRDALGRPGAWSMIDVGSVDPRQPRDALYSTDGAVGEGSRRRRPASRSPPRPANQTLPDRPGAATRSRRSVDEVRAVPTMLHRTDSRRTSAPRRCPNSPRRGRFALTGVKVGDTCT